MSTFWLTVDAVRRNASATRALPMAHLHEWFAERTAAPATVESEGIAAEAGDEPVKIDLARERTPVLEV